MSIFTFIEAVVIILLFLCVLANSADISRLEKEVNELYLVRFDNITKEDEE